MSPRNPTSLNGKAENVLIDSPSILNSEKALQELIEQPLVQGIDDHLSDFSEALQTVAKTLRKVTEGKVSAQAEAAEWKRKYELERERNLQLEKKGGQLKEQTINRAGKMKDQLLLSDESNDQCELSNGKNDICAHEILRDGVRDSDSCAIQSNKMMGKASFKLTWCCKGEKSDRHKHDIVSFDKGNITTAERSSKQISLKWESPPQTVLIMTKPNSTYVRVLCLEMIRWLKEQKNLNIIVEPRVRTDLLTESSYYSFVQTWLDEKDMFNLHTKVDFVVTLGGDGTVLWTASMFKGPVPPIVPFSLGSLGFMTPFQWGKISKEGAIHTFDHTLWNSEHYRERLDSILVGPISISLRHRLQCHIVRDAANSKYENVGPTLVLNEVTIDRGISSFLTNLECYCDNSFVTLVQGDGLILSTTSGSTAYSLAAGGSMVHPQVPGILFTPICPHSLSFRPLILPEHVTLKVLVPLNSRGHAWVSFDGKDRKQLAPGDALVCGMAPWPVPTACQDDSTGDFLRSINEGLLWNLRKNQSFDGPRDT